MCVGWAIAVVERGNIAGQHDLQKVAYDGWRSAHADFEAALALIVVQLIKVRVAIGSRVGVDAKLRC